jgi:hypothetical protein
VLLGQGHQGQKAGHNRLAPEKNHATAMPPLREYILASFVRVGACHSSSWKNDEFQMM